MRIISIRHRRKRTKAGEARPTQIAIFGTADAEPKTYDLKTEQDELDFMLGLFPTKWQTVAGPEIPEDVLSRHREPIKVDGEPTGHFRIPASYEGLTVGDTVLSILGGSGDRFCFALSRRSDEIGALVYRLAAFELKKRRQTEDKEDDTLLLANIWRSEQGLFHHMTPADRDLIELKLAYQTRQEAQQARIACENRLYERSNDAIFLSKDGKYPEGLIKDEWDKIKANDAILNGILVDDGSGKLKRAGGLVQEENKRTVELQKLVRALPVWYGLLKDVEGMGEVIAAGIIVAIGDVRRFPTDAKLKRFCGVHVMPDGRFPRRRTGELANWHPNARQSLYQFGEQMVRRPESHWGVRQLQYKANMRVAHPVAIVGEKGKKKYTNGHIHKMATWRAITRFTEWLHREWTRLEKKRQSNDGDGKQSAAA